MSKISIFSHKATTPETNSRQLRRDDVECFTQKEIQRQKNALEDAGYEVQVVLKEGWDERRGGSGKQPRRR